MDGDEESPSVQTCQFWIAKKKRLCKFEVAVDQRYCGNHAHLAQQHDNGKEQDTEHVSAQHADTDNGQAGKSKEATQRIPCPADPHHTVPVNQLESHLKKCPAARRQAAIQATPYYKENINAGEEVECENIPPSSAMDQQQSLPENNDTHTASSLQASNPFAPGTAAYRSGLARAMGKEAFLSFLDRLASAYTKVCRQPPPLSVQHPACADMEAVQHPSVSAVKHARQGLSIIGNLLEAGLLPVAQGSRSGHFEGVQNAAADHNDRNAAHSLEQSSSGQAATCTSDSSTQQAPGQQGIGVLVELGAGKAGLTALMATTIPRQHAGVHTAVMIDYKAGLKGKADRLMRNTLELHRVTMDLKDLNIHRLPALQAAQSDDAQRQQQFPSWLVVAKHLCGAATDYALRACLRHASSAGHTQHLNGCEESATEERVGRSLKGIAIATCCHHRCGWKPYVGKQLFNSLGFTATEFEILSWMTGWALCGHDAAPGQCTEHGDETSMQQHTQETDEGTMNVAQQQQQQQQGPDASCQIDSENEQEGQAKRMRLSLDGQQKSTNAQPRSSMQEQGPIQKHIAQQNILTDQSANKIQHTDVIVLDTKTPINEWQGCEWDPAKGLTRASKMRLGAMAKLLIDRGRLEWVSAQLGLTIKDTPSWQAQFESLPNSGTCGSPHKFACFRRYIDETVSGENKMILVRM